MEGWTLIFDVKTDPRRNVYGFRVTLWEIARDGEGLSHPLEAVENADMNRLIRECVVDNASNRMNMNLVFDLLGGKGKPRFRNK